MANHYYGGREPYEDQKVAVVASQFNSLITDRLVDGCLERLERHGVTGDQVDVWHVPGSFELPAAAKQLAGSGRYDAVICLGAVIRGETDHYDYVCQAAAEGIARCAYETGVPTIFGVVTTDTLEQALVRAGGKGANKGSEAAEAALTMASLSRQWRSLGAE